MRAKVALVQLHLAQRQGRAPPLALRRPRVCPGRTNLGTPNISYLHPEWFLRLLDDARQDSVTANP